MRPTAFALLAVALLAAPAFADGFIVPVRDPEPFRGLWAVKDHVVTITVAGQEARTEVRQTFVNLSEGDLEVQYLFPVPEGALIRSFSLVVDGKTLEGRLLPADEATRIYEDIVRRKKDPALLTYAGRGLVKTSVFPIPPRGSREVVVRYDELLLRDGDLTRLVYPLDTERFSARPLERVSVRVDLSAGAPIKSVYSPSHAVRVERPSAERAVATWSAERVLPDQDFTLFYATDVREVGASVLTFFPPGAEAGHFLLLLSAGSLDGGREPLPRDLVAVLDHSGSMQGKKIEQAKEALRFVVNSLSPRDRLNIVAFGSTARALFDRARAVGPETRDEALRFIDGIGAGGGTDIHSALTLALAGLGREEGREAALLFLTDGLPTVGVQDPLEITKAVKAANGAAARLFVFGVGYDLNAAFLDRLVEENGGVSENVAPSESVEIAVTGLWRKIRHTALRGLTLAVEGVRVFDEYPRPLPDLFDGQMLVVAGRYERGGRARVVLGGRATDGERRLVYDVVFDPATDPDGRPFVARVWAGMKIGFLLDQMRVLGRREKEIVDEVVRLSERYGIVTEYTAFLADEGNDFRDATANAEQARKDLEDKLARDSGGEGVNQAMNTKRLRAQQQAEGQSRWNDAEGHEIVVSTVRNLGRKTFYRRGGAWIDREAAEQVDEEVRQWSDRFFELVRGQRAAENAWLAFDEPVVVRLGARTVRILPAE